MAAPGAVMDHPQVDDCIVGEGEQPLAQLCRVSRDGGDLLAVELPYDGQELAMLFIVPDADTFRTFQGKLTASSSSAIISGMSTVNVDLSLPRFTFDDKHELNQALNALGMSAMFTGTNFDSIDGGKGILQVSKVVHKTFIQVNEQNAEAAGATGITMDGGVGKVRRQHDVLDLHGPPLVV